MSLRESSSEHREMHLSPGTSWVSTSRGGGWGICGLRGQIARARPARSGASINLEAVDILGRVRVRSECTIHSRTLPSRGVPWYDQSKSATARL